MLRIQTCQNEAAAKQYFTSSLDRGDYYMSDQELPGVWGGRGAKLLGLSGTVTQKDFFMLSENRNPKTGERLTARTKANRRIGYDFNFNCAKGISIEFALKHSTKVMDAARSAVDDTMDAIECDAKCRVRKGRQNHDRKTGNLTWAVFTHLTSRPVDGVPDPHLHFHVFTFNNTFDAEENKWKAVQLGDIKKDAPFFESLFHAHLAENLEKAGFWDIKRGNATDLGHIPESCIEKFSRRTKQIEQESSRIGIKDAIRKAALGSRTRERKNKSLTKVELTREWLSRLTEDEKKAIGVFGSPIRHLEGHKKRRLPGITRDAKNAVQFALKKAFEHESVVSEKRLLGIALRNAEPKTSSVSVHRAFEELDLIRDDSTGRTLVTTTDILREERRMVAFAKQGRGTCVPFAVNATPNGKDELTTEQGQTFQELLASTDRVSILRGPGGTGKTTLMEAFQSAVEKRGQHVFRYTPTHSSGDGKNSVTVARLLADKEEQKQLKGQVLWIDEAGMLGVRTMAKVFDVAKRQNARVVLSGDYKRHRPVERGGAFGILAKEAGLHSVSLKSIQRQRGALKTVVTKLSQGMLNDAWHRLARLGAVREMPVDEAHKRIAEEYVQAVRRKQTAMVLSPTRRERDRVSKAIRKELRDQGVLKGRDRTFESLRRVGLSVAERRSGEKIRRGQVIAFSRPTRGFRSGDRAKVYGRDLFGNIWVKGKVGPTILNRRHADRFDVFEKEKIQLARGDRIRFTRNGRTVNGKRVVRKGSEYRIWAFVPFSGDLILSNGWIVKRGHGHLEHAYCDTSFSGQTKTADHVFIAQSRDSLRPTSREQFYSDVTRAREQVHVFTDDVDALRDRLDRDTSQLTARELQDMQRAAAREHRANRMKETSHDHSRDR